MSFLIRCLPVAILASLALGPTAAKAQTEVSAPDSSGVIVAAESGAVVVPANTPLEREFAALRGNFRTRLTELTNRYAAAPDAKAAAAAQVEITALKLQLEIDLLDLQLRMARERSDTEAIAELEPIRTVARERLVSDTGLEAPAAPAVSTKK